MYGLDSVNRSRYLGILYDIVSIFVFFHEIVLYLHFVSFILKTIQFRKINTFTLSLIICCGGSSQVSKLHTRVSSTIIIIPTGPPKFPISTFVQCSAAVCYFALVIFFCFSYNFLIIIINNDSLPRFSFGSLPLSFLLVHLSSLELSSPQY